MKLYRCQYAVDGTCADCKCSRWGSHEDGQMQKPCAHDQSLVDDIVAVVTARLVEMRAGAAIVVLDTDPRWKAGQSLTVAVRVAHG